MKSQELKISGICDVVEFIRNDQGISLHGAEGTYLPYPVEYKRGKPKISEADILQLTAQALCLEEMLLCRIEYGYLFYNEIKHRTEVQLTEQIKDRVKHVVGEMYDYYERRHTPKVKTGSYCQSCSLQSLCLPQILTSVPYAVMWKGKFGNEEIVEYAVRYAARRIPFARWR